MFYLVVADHGNYGYLDILRKLLLYTIFHIRITK